MSFESAIVKLSTCRQKNLARPAKIASESPETQVKILNSSAYHVIKDCADLTLQYLPHFLYGQLDNPIQQLKKRTTESDIIDFVSRSNKSEATRQLLQIIIDDIVVKKPDISATAVTDFTIPEGVDDVYGEYGYGSETTQQPEETATHSSVDINDSSAVIDLLIDTLL